MVPGRGREESATVSKFGHVWNAFSLPPVGRLYALPSREGLKQLLSHFVEKTDILSDISLETLESQDRRLKFQGVRFEVRSAAQHSFYHSGTREAS